MEQKVNRILTHLIKLKIINNQLRKKSSNNTLNFRRNSTSSFGRVKADVFSMKVLIIRFSRDQHWSDACLF